MVCMRDKAKRVGRISGDAGVFPEYEVKSFSTQPVGCTPRCSTNAVVVVTAGTCE